MRHEVDREDLGAERPQLLRADVGRDHADQERDHRDDRHGLVRRSRTRAARPTACAGACQERQAEPAVLRACRRTSAPRTSCRRGPRARGRAGRGRQARVAVARRRPCARSRRRAVRRDTRSARAAGRSTAGAVAASAMARCRSQAGPMSKRPAADRSTLRDPAAAHSRKRGLERAEIGSATVARQRQSSLGGIARGPGMRRISA